MVAGGSACSCPSCHAVCTGRFSGCAKVWARGPVKVALGSGAETQNPTTGNGVAAAGDNGSTPSDELRTAAVDVASVPVVRSDEIQILVAEVRALTERVQEASVVGSTGGAENFETAANAVLTRLERLFPRMADAMAKALTTQHHMIMKDIHATLHEFEQRLESRFGEPTQGSDQSEG